MPATAAQHDGCILFTCLKFSNLPCTHPGEFRDVIAHGEALLLVEVAESRSAIIERSMPVINRR